MKFLKQFLIYRAPWYQDLVKLLPKPIPSLHSKFLAFFALMANSSWNAKETKFLFVVFGRAVRITRTTNNYRALVEKDVKSNGWSRPPAFDRFKSFNHDDLTVKHYFRCSRVPNIDGIKTLIKMTRLQNIKIKRTVFCGLFNFIKILIQSTSKFWFSQHQEDLREALSTQNNIVLQWDHHD